MPRGAPGGLDQAGLAAQKTLLVGIEDGNEGHLGQIEAFAQEVDAHEDVEVAETQVAQDLHAFDRVDVAVEILDADLRLAQVGCQVLRQPFGEGCHEHALAGLDGAVDLADQVLDLALDRPDGDLGIEQPGRADELLGDDGRGVHFEGRRGRRHVEGLAGDALELLEALWPVVEGRGQAEAEVDQGLFPRAVAVVHAADLGDGRMTLVDHQQVILREEVEETERPVPRLPAAEVARVVLDAVAEAHLLEHLEIVVGAHADALGLEELAVLLELGHAFLQLGLDRADGRLELAAGGDVLVRRIEIELIEVTQDFARGRVKLVHRVDLLAEELHPQAKLGVRRHDVHDIAAHAEATALRLVVVPLVEVVHELLQQDIPAKRVMLAQRDSHLGEVLGRAQAVDAGHAGDHDHVAPRDERACGRDAEALDLLVDGRVLLDEGVARRDVGLGLVIIVVADEVLDGVVGEEILELRVELRRQRLVMGDDERRPVALRDHVGHGEGLPRARDPQQRLVPVPRLDRGHQLRDRLRLIPGGFVVGLEGEEHEAGNVYR